MHVESKLTIVTLGGKYFRILSDCRLAVLKRMSFTESVSLFPHVFGSEQFCQFTSKRNGLFCRALNETKWMPLLPTRSDRARITMLM